MLKAVGNYVVLKAVEDTKKEDEVTENGVVIPASLTKKTTGQWINNPSKTGKILVHFFIDSIGSGVDTDKYNLSVGDEVIANDYDIQSQGDKDGETYGICKVESIKAIVTKE